MRFCYLVPAAKNNARLTVRKADRQLDRPTHLHRNPQTDEAVCLPVRNPHPFIVRLRAGRFNMMPPVQRYVH